MLFPVSLRRRQAVAATAQVLFQRFYCKKSFKAYNVKARRSALHLCAFSFASLIFTCSAFISPDVSDRSSSLRNSASLFLSLPQRVASASVFLAAKLEEDVKKYRDVINTFHRLERRREGKSLDFVEPARPPAAPPPFRRHPRFLRGPSPPHPGADLAPHSPRRVRSRRSKWTSSRLSSSRSRSTCSGSSDTSRRSAAAARGSAQAPP